MNLASIFQAQKGFQNDLLLTGSNLEQLLLMADIRPRLLKANCLHHKRGGFIQSPQDIFAFFIKHIVHATVKLKDACSLEEKL